MARPTKYTNKLLARAKQYLEDWDKDGDVIPSHVGLALRLGIRRETMYAWAKDKDKEVFSNILDQVLALQQNKLLNNGLNGVFNSAITKLVLGKHGYHEKQDIEHGGTVATPVTVTFVGVPSDTDSD